MPKYDPRDRGEVAAARGDRGGTKGTSGTHGERKEPTGGAPNRFAALRTGVPRAPAPAVAAPAPTFPGNLTPDFIQQALGKSFWGDQGAPGPGSFGSVPFGGGIRPQMPMGGSPMPPPLAQMAMGSPMASRPGPLPGVPVPGAPPGMAQANMPPPGMIPGGMAPPTGLGAPAINPGMPGMPKGPRPMRAPMPAGGANPFIRQLQ